MSVMTFLFLKEFKKVSYLFLVLAALVFIAVRGLSLAVSVAALACQASFLYAPFQFIYSSRFVGQ